MPETVEDLDKASAQAWARWAEAERDAWKDAALAYRAQHDSSICTCPGCDLSDPLV